jgi:hypothetical protein
MKAEQTLRALYEFTSQQYENLKTDYNKLPKQEKSKLPFTLFIIGVFSSLIEESKNKSNDKSIQEKNMD